MSNDTAISVNDVHKEFILPHERVNTIKGAFTGLMRGKNSGRTLERQQALQGVSFDIKEGEFFGIVGRNGSGKSTLLKIIAEIYTPTSGTISVKGRLVPFIELGVGFNPELTGRENVYLSASLMGFSRVEIDAMYSNIVDFAELEKFMDQKLKNYSSGMQVRLAFSIATRAEGDILLIDEVLAVGDADFQRKCFDYFKTLKKQKKTVVFVSHNMEAIKEYCDRAVLIEKSKVVQEGETVKIAELYTKMFTKGKNAKKGSDKDTRWGNFLAETKSIKATADKSIVINHEIIASTDLPEYELGFRIRNNAGVPIMGTNTKLERTKIKPLKKGESCTMTWRFDNILSDGEYSLDIAIVQDDGVTVIEWWDDAMKLSVKKPRHLSYSVDPTFTAAIQ